MFYTLSRILAFVAQPFTYIVSAFILAIILPVKWKRTRMACAVVAVALTLIFTNPLLYTHAQRCWQPQQHTTHDTTHYDYGVVLGGFGHYDTFSGNIDYQKAIDRLFTAVRYYREGRVKYIIISGDGLTTDSATFYREMQQLYNIPPQALIREPLARSTRENAEYVASILASHPSSRVAVFTSAVHIPRSRYAFEQAGVMASYITCDYRSRKDSSYAMWMPSTKVLTDWDELIHEWIGYMAYQL